MTRGRKKDLTIPPSRALTQQRDYRARKAKYVAELEDRYRKVEAENVSLRAEIETLRAGLPFTQSVDSRVLSASSDLLRDLNNVSAAITRFQTLAYSQTSIPPHAAAVPAENPVNGTVQTPASRLRPAFFPSPTPSSSSLLMSCDSEGHSPSDRSWSEENSRPPESLRKILCDSDIPTYSSPGYTSQDKSPSQSPRDSERGDSPDHFMSDPS
ncbi:hypothetical protein D9758_011791 [Tetrapyrgos nigripes]|uniref:BZIP domain-containing protein n=1 Tax=Tetrapyrgos nigripes TaxID=182062 RepID=A0A8H5FUL1_9AGAR|nr:hypothetical protein D9758_011791 [Tetrapyrgos nigripes]